MKEKNTDKNKETSKEGRARIGNVLRHAMFPVLAVVFVGGYLIWSAASGESITVENIVEHTPGGAFPAALMLVLFYILKSLSVFFPVTVLYAVGGYIFGPVLGCVINAVGVAAGCAVQYWIGRSSGSHAAERLCQKHPRIAEFMGAQDRSAVAASFWSRLLGVFSGDIVSYYFGASGTRFWSFMTGSMLGVLPVMILVTTLGTSVSDPSSPMFIISVVLIAAVMVLTLAGRMIYKKISARKKNKSGKSSADGENDQ